MSLDNLLMGGSSAPTSYSMQLDPIFGPLFQAQIGAIQPPSGPGAGPTGAVGGSPSHWEQVAKQMAARRYGWTGQDWNALDQIATAESGWNPNAVNSSSGAAGIPQMLPSAHPDINVQQFMSNPQAQIRWFLNYIKGRYGTPSDALSVRNQQGWY
jgi:Transglycosylase SLT domain.